MKKVSFIAFFGISAFCSFASGNAEKATGAETKEKPVAAATVNESDDPSPPPPPPGETIYRSTRNSVPVMAEDEDDILGTNVYSGSSSCRSYWLAQPLHPGSPRTNAYYYYANGTGTQTTPPSIFLTYCP